MSQPAQAPDPRSQKLCLLPGPFPLEGGGVLRDLTLSYETWGALNEAGDNAVFLCHALTGGPHAASHGPQDEPGWWEGLVGPGRTLDPSRYFLVCANIPGGCYGSTGPGSADPKTGRPYGASFPVVTTRDAVRAFKALLDHLGVRRLALVLGGSLGAMLAWQWAVQFPDFVAAAVPIAGPFRATAWSIALNAAARRAIELDPAWRQGRYEGNGPERGLALARAIAMVSYRSEGLFEERFGRERLEPEAAARLSASNPFQVERYLAYQGEKLVRRFDARSYVAFTRMMDLHDASAGFASPEEAMATIRAPVLVVGIDSDVLFAPGPLRATAERLAALGARASYAELSSRFGHDAFLVETAALDLLLAAFLGKGRPPCAF
ncbi:MAG: homoserine O-acetyltransferase MetX [Acidobacteriota bacterium]